MTPVDPPPPPPTPGGQPRWLVVLLAAGLSLLVGAVLLLVLQLVGIDQIGLLGLLLVLIAAAVAGGYATRAVATRLPPMGRGPRG
ncbi:MULTISPECIES: hypothetical protein [unclassified Modestobacter]